MAGGRDGVVTNWVFIRRQLWKVLNCTGLIKLSSTINGVNNDAEVVYLIELPV